jgi:hypothetical protein
MTNRHPSTNTNSKSLNGIETIAGDNCDIPIAEITAAITKSNTKNGKQI